MQTYQLSVGSINCTVISEGRSSFDAKYLSNDFVNSKDEDVQTARTRVGHNDEQENAFMNPLLIETPEQRILVDAGYGAMDEGDSYNKLVPNLKAFGIEPSTIDIVLLTHLHSDHIGGLLDAEGNEIFTNANYITQQIEWDFWMNEETIASMGDYGQQYSVILKSVEDKFKFVSDRSEIVPGVAMIPAFGHTLGHCAVLIESQGERLLHAVDILHHPVQFANPTWQHQFDSNKELASETRQKILSYATEEDLLTLFYHLPFPGLGKVKYDNKAFQWMPINS